MTSPFVAGNPDPHPNRLKALKKHLQEMLQDPEKAQKEHDELMASLQSHPKSHTAAHDYLKRKTRASIRREQQTRQREINSVNETTETTNEPRIVQELDAVIPLEEQVLDAITDEATKTQVKALFEAMREARENPPTEEQIQAQIELMKASKDWPA
ncbi:hypothetical protein R3P38DRAFT_3208002 [Favolaschia claudopus]|uniref:Uncharacterized protein n=1 Tax=Favolaschia claudopus TaxID=2862362 RepID=A0AAW0AK32_9AGAR